MIEKFVFENDLIVHNSGETTFIHPAYQTETCIDLSISSPSLALDYSWTRHDDQCGSDHFPIIIGCNGCQEEDTVERWNFKKANWDKFSRNCSDLINDSVLIEPDPVSCFTEKLIQAAEDAIPIKVSKGKCFPRVPWFTETCKNAVKERKKAQRKYFKNPTFENFFNLKKEKAKTKFTIKNAKRNSWRQFISKLNTQTSSKKVWDAVKRIQGRKSSSGICLKQNNQLIGDKKETANHLAKTFVLIPLLNITMRTSRRPRKDKRKPLWFFHQIIKRHIMKSSPLTN